MGHYDECREGNCPECGQLWGYCLHTKGVRDIKALQKKNKALQKKNEALQTTINLIDKLGFHVGTRTLNIIIDECYHKCPYFSIDSGNLPTMVCSHPSVDDKGYIINQATCHGGFPPKCPLWKE